MIQLRRPKSVRLGYWDIRGLGAPLRMLLAYSGIEHNLVFHKEEDDGTWFEDNKPRQPAVLGDGRRTRRLREQRVPDVPPGVPQPRSDGRRGKDPELRAAIGVHEHAK